jgi:UDP-GlcNAc:undecaprenyl-phosphate/decaprenyl-phosphate GlcNAc-1-phosphate transferase
MTFISTSGDAVVPSIMVFIAAAAIALVLTPVIRRIVIRYEILDQPEERRVNVVPVPRGGGLAISAAFLLVAGVFLLVNDRADLLSVPVTLEPSDVGALLLGGAAAAALGAIDDLFDLRARWQLLGQIGLALAAVAAGVTIDFIANPISGGIQRFEGWMAAGLTIFWIVGMINSINWIDGLDGLACGVAFIAAVTLGIISLTTQVGQPLVAVLCFALAGALLGFLRWNFYPATIFAGTSGVQFVGYTLAILAILGTAKVAVAVLVLGVPIIDTFWIIVRRLSQRRSPFSPDRTHIHHRLLDLGLSHRATVLVIYGMCVVFALLGLLLSGANQLYAFLGVFVAFGLILFIPTRGRFIQDLEARSYVNGGHAHDHAGPPDEGDRTA